MSKVRLSFVYLCIIAISNRIIFGELLSVYFHLGLFLGVCVLIAPFLKRSNLLFLVKQKSFILSLTTFLLILILPNQFNSVRLLLFILFCFFIGKSLQNSKIELQISALFNALGLTTFLFLVFYYLYNSEPIVWINLQLMSQKISSFLGKITNQNILLNVTASGLFITILFILFGFSIALVSLPNSSHRRSKLIIYIITIFLINDVFIIILHPLTNVIQSSITDITLNPMNVLFILLILDGIPLWWFLNEISLRGVSYELVPKKYTLILTILTCLISCVIILNSSFTKKAQAKNNILIYSRGYFNFDKPVFGRYGLTQGGMFGMFQEYLNLMGYSTVVDSVLNKKNLDYVNVVVIINLDRFIPQNEKNELKKFVNGGGSLLVMGDHTGLGGIMDPLNDLLSFVNIKFNYDCGHYLTNTWRDQFELTTHPIFEGVNDEIDIGIEIGASLSVSPLTSKPILFAKYGFSDKGDPLNFQNAFLGNRKYDAGELLGDIILVAESTFGKGKVLVFGDTSSFQNGNLVYTFNFVQNVFKYLTSSNSAWDNSLLVRSIYIFLLLIGVFAVFLTKPFIKPASLLWVSSTLFFASIWISIFTMLGKTNPRYDIENNKNSIIKKNIQVAYIDASHINEFSHYGDDGIWALTYHLMRNKYLPLVQRNFSPELLNKCSVAFFINPRVSINANFLDIVDSYVKKGGTAVFSSGYEEKEQIENVLNKYGFDEDNLPLGPVPDTETTSKIQFSKAWPIIIIDNHNVDTLSIGWDYPIIISKKVGKGKFILVADPLFFLSEGLEKNHQYPNSNFLFRKIISFGP